MASPAEATLPATRKKSRKSIAHLPSAENKENMTADVGELAGKNAFTSGGRPKKSRSKSIGPGGLDTLTDTALNRRKSVAVGPLPRSILKPTLPLLPLPEIPAHGASRRPGSNLSGHRAHSADLIDFREASSTSSASVSGIDKLADPFQTDKPDSNSQTRVLLKSEEEQQAAAREREKQAADQELAARREARRKSLANRRVSFAPEATLHTWDTVECAQDSTTSSASTNSTRRASSAHSASGESPQRAHADSNSDPPEAPSTPPEQLDEPEAESSPAHQRELHQKKRRRSSGIPPMNFNNPDEGFSSSPYAGSSNGSDDVNEAFDAEGDENEDSNSGSEDGTMMSLDEDGDTTSMSVASVRSNGSSTLERNLRLAGTRGLDSDEDRTRREPEPEDDEVIASFKPWAKKAGPVQNLSSMQDQENVNPFSPAFKAGIKKTADVALEEEDATMEVTRAVGGIITGSQSTPKNSRRQSLRRRSSGEGSSLGDETMDLTMAVGGIQTQNQVVEEQASDNEDEEMTMELTTVIGGVLPRGNNQAKSPRRSPRRQTAAQIRTARPRTRASMESAAGDEAMEITTAIGGILPRQSHSTPDVVEDDATMEMDIDMDMTNALGRILPNKRAEAKRIMEMEVDAADVGSSPFQTMVPSSPPKMPAAIPTTASETGSPSLAPFQGRGLRRSTGARKSSTPKSTPKSPAKASVVNETPLKKVSTPSKQSTPKPGRPTTPGKTPPSRNVDMRSASPKRLFQNEIKAAQSTPKPVAGSTPNKGQTPNRLFQKDSRTGVATPSIILTPRSRRSSGIGADKPGIGSPRVAALLDRRTSIGESALSFEPQQSDQARHNVRFEDPRALELEVDIEREKEESRENRRSILEREVNPEEEEKDATVNLKEMIQSLTPKKYRPLKGRKSLHVGAAKGILGKRPAELDEDDEDDHDDQEGVNRLKGHQDSPVKKIKLRAPPSQEELTGRMTRSARKSLDNTAGSIVTPTTASSPSKPTPARTPQNQGRFKDMAGQLSPEKVTPFNEKLTEEAPEVNEDIEIDDRVHLQDFLNMTSIRFMELTTTKRRHTVAPNAASQDSSQSTHSENNSPEGSGFESCVVAGACTVPMLELYQHSCRELKKYISEGRSVVREIEAVTFEENPPLFQEYISAAPEVKTLMDNQFKIVKTHARLLSKGMWYEWRMKLLDGLRDGLFKIGQDMSSDRESLQQQQDLLDSILPSMIQKFEQLQQEESEMRTNAEELANCDQEELAEARQQLVEVDSDIEAKKKMITDLRNELEAKEAAIKSGNERKQACHEDIKAAEKTREECRGWSAKEVAVLKANVDELEKKTGWTITGVSGNTLSMTFRKEIELVLDVTAFKPNKSSFKAKNSSNSPIDLWYIAADREHNPLPKTPEKDFFLANIRDHIRGLPQAETSFKDLLHSVSSSWLKASSVIEDASFLHLSNYTQATKTSDSSIVFKSTLILRPLSTKVMINFDLSIQSSTDGFDIEIEPSAKVAYGERFNEPKMKEFLISKIGTRVTESNFGKNMWGLTVASLEEKLLARGKK